MNPDLDLDLDDFFDQVAAVHGLRMVLWEGVGADVQTSSKCDACTISRQDAPSIVQLVCRALGREAAPEAPSDSVRTLHALLESAGIPAQVAADGRTCTLDARAALRLKHLIHDAMQDMRRPVTDLTVFFADRGLRAIQPVLIGGMVDLGEVSIPVATRLAVLLGASPKRAPADQTNTLARWAYGLALTQQLDAALTETVGSSINNRFNPDCARCGSECDITLGRITTAQGERLLEVLRAAP